MTDRDIRKRLTALEGRGSEQTGQARLSARRETMIGDMQSMGLEQWRAKYAQELAGQQYPMGRETPGYPATGRFLRDLAASLGVEACHA